MKILKAKNIRKSAGNCKIFAENLATSPRGGSLAANVGGKI